MTQKTLTTTSSMMNSSPRYTLQQKVDDPLHEIYIFNHWSYRLDSPSQQLDNDLLQYDLPLGMGLNDPLPPEDNLLFNKENAIYLDPLENSFQRANQSHTNNYH